jgi:hypothetical protein
MAEQPLSSDRETPFGALRPRAASSGNSAGKHSVRQQRLAAVLHPTRFSRTPCPRSAVGSKPDVQASGPQGWGECSPPLPERNAPLRNRRCSSARRRGRARPIGARADRARASVASGTRGRGVHRGEPVARLARRFAVNLES